MPASMRPEGVCDKVAPAPVKIQRSPNSNGLAMVACMTSNSVNTDLYGALMMFFEGGR
jgi:hypothetical protein